MFVLLSGIYKAFYSLPSCKVHLINYDFDHVSAVADRIWIDELSLWVSLVETMFLMCSIWSYIILLSDAQRAILCKKIKCVKTRPCMEIGKNLEDALCRKT